MENYEALLTVQILFSSPHTNKNCITSIFQNRGQSGYNWSTKSSDIEKCIQTDNGHGKGEGENHETDNFENEVIF